MTPGASCPFPGAGSPPCCLLPCGSFSRGSGPSQPLLTDHPTPSPNPTGSRATRAPSGPHPAGLASSSSRPCSHCRERRPAPGGGHPRPAWRLVSAPATEGYIWTTGQLICWDGSPVQGPPPAREQLMTTRGWKVKPPFADKAAQPTLRPPVPSCHALSMEPWGDQQPFLSLTALCNMELPPVLLPSRAEGQGGWASPWSFCLGR
ncbi:proline-rich protein 2-like [Rhinolophus ferrumequinum]|uniref:proline-rich protein 2-like n=1 Tax=Rhinolophus ferrumequinum TaxID=59479 RepID=UPI00140FDD8B|nr:proline-rich protein 2-like [Rhinolophus ferrumequinum]